MPAIAAWLESFAMRASASSAYSKSLLFLVLDVAGTKLVSLLGLCFLKKIWISIVQLRDRGSSFCQFSSNVLQIYAIAIFISFGLKLLVSSRPRIRRFIVMFISWLCQC